MFTEVLRIKPVLDESAGKQMESSLSNRFLRVTKLFRTGLKAAITGSALGLGVGLLNKLLNPIEELENKIKTLLDQGTELTDLAEKFGATPGELKQLEAVAKSFNVSPDKFKEVLLKFTEAADKAQEELKNPLQVRSEGTQILGDIANNKNRVQGFMDFMKLLQQTGQGNGTDKPLTARAQKVYADAAAANKAVDPKTREELIKTGQVQVRSAAETKKEFEKTIFGSAQFGGVERLINSDVQKRAQAVNLPSAQAFDQTAKNLASADQQKAVLDAQNQSRDFINAGNKINSDMVAALARSQARDEANITDRLNTYKAIADGADTLKTITHKFDTMLDKMTEQVGYLGKLANSSWVKGFFKTNKD